MILLNKYLYECQFKSKAHHEAENDNRKKNKTMNWSQSILGLLCSALTMSIYNKHHRVIIVSSSILSLTASIIGVTRSVYKYNSKQQSHHIDYLNYSNLASDIVLFFDGKIKNKNEISIFTELVHEKLDIYNSISSSIPLSYLENAKKKTQFPIRPNQVPSGGRVEEKKDYEMVEIKGINRCP